MDTGDQWNLFAPVIDDDADLPGCVWFFRDNTCYCLDLKRARVVEVPIRESEPFSKVPHEAGSSGLIRLAQALALSRTLHAAALEFGTQSLVGLGSGEDLCAATEAAQTPARTVLAKSEPPSPAASGEARLEPIRIYTLGRFEILCNDQPLCASSKLPHKPLALLKCICALGGTAINQYRLCDALWPDAQGDVAEQALRTTLHRLRRLLRYPQAIRFKNHHLSLDHRLIWVDCLAFDHVAHHPDKTDRASMIGALNQYRGHFLAGDSAPWALIFRERLRAHYKRMTEHLGTLLEQSGDWSGAADVYLRALEIEPTAESLYRRAMNCYSQLGRRAEALALYQRCRHTLLAQLGLSPNRETQALSLALSGQQPSSGPPE